MAKGRYQDWLTEEGLLRIEGWARDGLTEEDIAYNMGITRTTLYNWKEKYADILNALKSGKDVADRRVENALYKRALGYEYDEVTSELDINENLMITKVVKKQVAPDVTAQIFWLKNRKPQEWRDKRDIEHSGGVTNSVNLSGLSVEDLRNIAKMDDANETD